jgi:hypothetical protein
MLAPVALLGALLWLLIEQCYDRNQRDGNKHDEDHVLDQSPPFLTIEEPPKHVCSLQGHGMTYGQSHVRI